MSKKSFQIGVEGMKSLTDALKKLGDRAPAVVRPAVRKAAEIVREAAAAEAPIDDGTLKGSMIVKVANYRSTGTSVAIIGANWLSARHDHLVEFGTGPRVRKDGRSAGAMPANPFMRRAFDRTKDQVQQSIEREILREIEKGAAE